MYLYNTRMKQAQKVSKLVWAALFVLALGLLYTTYAYPDVLILGP